MYGLKQAALLAYEHLIKCLEPHGYRPMKHTLGMWEHISRPTKFCLCVDNFGVKYFSKEDANHLLDSLKNYYKITVDWEGKNYCGLDINWNYNDGFVDVSMSKYIPTVLHCFQHQKPTKPCYAPHEWTLPAYGQRVQFPTKPDESPFLDKKQTQEVQSITGSLLYYSRAVDPTMLPALNEIATQQAKPTINTLKKCRRLLDYCATYPNAILRFHASDMILHVDTDAAYLVLPGARSRIAGYYYLSSKLPQSNVATLQPAINGPILVECKTLTHVVTSAAEAETGGLFHNGQTIIPIRIALEELGHPQPPTPLKTDNSTATGCVNKSMKQKRSKSWDMRYHWLRERLTLQQLFIFWDKGINNLADYFTKHHPPKYHRFMRPRYIHMINQLIKA
jgi:hypothetical protein